MRYETREISEKRKATIEIEALSKRMINNTSHEANTIDGLHPATIYNSRGLIEGHRQYLNFIILLRDIFQYTSRVYFLRDKPDTRFDSQQKQNE